MFLKHNVYEKFPIDDNIILESGIKIFGNQNYLRVDMEMLNLEKMK